MARRPAAIINTLKTTDHVDAACTPAVRSFAIADLFFYVSSSDVSGVMAS
jgi:hypothetical protein